MKSSSRKKGLRSARIAAAVSAMLLLGTALSGCHDSQNRSNDEVKLTVAEEGDLASGKPYKIRADRNVQELRADHGEITTVNPVTGENAGANEWFYVFSEENFTSYELNLAGNSGAPDNDVNDGADSDEEKSALKSFTETFHATLENGKTQEAKQTFAVTDPLLPEQWHLYNIGQNPYGVTDAPFKKIDINVIPAWRIILPEDKKQIDGSGVYVAVFDAPVDLNHEDLRDRIYDPGIPGTADYVNIGLPLEMLKEDAFNHHGTSVAGIIAASGMNKLGGRGLAFNAMLTSFANTAADESLNLYAMLTMDQLNLVNASIGVDLFSYHRQAIWELYEALFENNIAFIQAQGNDFRFGHHDIYRPYSTSYCLSAGSDCEYKQTDVMARFPFVIHVGALNSLGVKASYGSTGANLWVTGFGGESGANVTAPSGTKSSAAIVTTLSSYDPSEFDDHDKNSPWRNEDNKYYTNIMNGTSAAAPTVAGAVALAYQARPNMTVSELRYLLAKTSRNDTMMPTLALTPLEADDDTYKEKVTLDYGWQDNAAGYRFSNWYGFGVVDAGALVKAALDCDNDPVCAAMKELPEKYVSANENPCAYADDAKLLITCSFSDFKNEDGEALGKTELLADTVTYDVSGMNYLPEGIIEACELAASAEDEEATEHNLQRKHAVFQAHALLELIAESQSGTKSLLKPIYANWDYTSGFNIPVDDGDDDENDEDDEEDQNEDFSEGISLAPLDLATSAFYQEPLKEDPDRKYRLSVRSPCQIDVDELNENMHLTVYGRRK
ncbi:S8 family serine peptidase [Succinimonas sp.]|uniref:S8 family serine peptidase n=1 Tax=Succinimonas sp. TaxID=1936151 RepID=UPI003863389B